MVWIGQIVWKSMFENYKSVSQSVSYWANWIHEMLACLKTCRNLSQFLGILMDQGDFKKGKRDFGGPPVSTSSYLFLPSPSLDISELIFIKNLVWDSNTGLTSS